MLSAPFSSTEKRTTPFLLRPNVHFSSQTPLSTANQRKSKTKASYPIFSLPFLSFFFCWRSCQPFNSFSSPIFQTVTNPFTLFPWPFIAISPCYTAVYGNLDAGSGMEGHGVADKWRVSRLGWYGYEADTAVVMWCRWLKTHGEGNL